VFVTQRSYKSVGEDFRPSSKVDRNLGILSILYVNLKMNEDLERLPGTYLHAGPSLVLHPIVLQ
jgi:hypothetical protein